MPTERSFRLNLQFAAASALIFALIHLITALFAYGGSHPIIPIKDPFILWEVKNNELALVTLFLWAGVQAWTAARSWSTRDRAHRRGGRPELEAPPGHTLRPLPPREPGPHRWSP